MMNERRLIVVGGGAAGFFAAIRAKTVNANLDVLLLEAAPKCLGKVLISGGGRCNVTHACFDVATLVQYYPRGQRELKGVFSRFGPQQTVAWFESHGVKLKKEPDGRMFPVTDQSETIADCLLQTAISFGVRIQTKAHVTDIVQLKSGFHVCTVADKLLCDYVLVATGGSVKAYEWLRSFGHTLVLPVPSLFTFKIQHPLLNDLSGISFQSVKASLKVLSYKPLEQSGPLLITHWGLSGPVILKLSAWGARLLQEARYQAQLTIDFFPEDTQETLYTSLLALKEAESKKQVGNLGLTPLPKRFWQALLSYTQIDIQQPWQRVSHKQLQQLASLMKRMEFPVQGKGVFKEEFVTAGGVALKEINFKTMESRCVENLFVAGEVIDVDGLTGGFNFQNAWSTGWIAGDAIAQKSLT